MGMMLGNVHLEIGEAQRRGHGEGVEGDASHAFSLFAGLDQPNGMPPPFGNGEPEFLHPVFHPTRTVRFRQPAAVRAQDL